ncbi:MAG: BLUF domain-containing protein [Bacteroidia bacterium]|nr:BLUF domain-containing protein [Bacteroidia bacterium]MBT8277585.1 BLUF domain-containing protein [Bacteroidia bacterium]
MPHSITDKYAISYVSHARVDLTHAEIDALFDLVMDFNLKNNITGILIYKEGDFLK